MFALTTSVPSQLCLLSHSRKAVLNCIECFADYARRLLLITRTWPQLLLWMVWQEPHVECSERQACASDLLAMGAQDLQERCSTTYKIRVLFERQIKHAALTGILDAELARLLNKLAEHWVSNTQAIEGTNSTVKHMCALSPSISWGLLAARITNKLFTSSYIPTLIYLTEMYILEFGLQFALEFVVEFVLVSVLSFHHMLQ